jgi:hypothetical protein
VDPAEVFVLPGAGASFCRPTALPLFAQIRDHILSGLGLSALVADGGAKRRLAEGIVPEAFMLSLVGAQIPVADWLGTVFDAPGPTPCTRCSLSWRSPAQSVDGQLRPWH